MGGRRRKQAEAERLVKAAANIVWQGNERSGLHRAEPSAYNHTQQLGGIAFSNWVQPKVKGWLLPFQFPPQTLSEVNMLNTWSSPQEATARSLTIIIGLDVRTKSENPLCSKCNKPFHAYICMNSNLTGLLVELETSVSCVWKVSFQSL